MHSLHAGFRERQFLLWSESAPPESADAAGLKLAEILLEIGLHPALDSFMDAPIWLPAVRQAPVPSSALIADLPDTKNARIGRFTVTAVALDPSSALELLCYCASKDLAAPGIMIGPDLAWWVAAMQFAGALVARQQFLPDLVSEDGGYHARWRAAFTGRDDERMHALASAMPPAARAFTPETPAVHLLGGFLDFIVDALVRVGSRGIDSKGVLHDRWLRALDSPDGKLTGTVEELRLLAGQLREWRRPISVAAAAPFRLCFRLEEPEFEGAGAWQVRYLLQSRKDPSLLVPADTIWKPKGAKSPVNGLAEHGFQPREHLLFSLGQASGVCPRIEESLKSRRARAATRWMPRARTIF